MKALSTPQSTEPGGLQKKHTTALVKTKDKLLRKIIAFLRLHHQLDTAFLISKQIQGIDSRHYFPAKKSLLMRHYTYTLCIMTNELSSKEKSANPLELMDALYNHTQKQARVYLISFTAAAVAEKINYGNNFLVRLLNEAQCVYSVDDWWVKWKRFGINRDPQLTESIKLHWLTRFERARYLHNITGMNSAESPMAHFGVLQQVVKQTCLGLIYLFWEFKPAYTGLPYLLHLCSHIPDFPGKLFQGSSYENQRLLHHLCQADHYMKFKVKSSLTLKDADKAWKKCESFLKEAQTLAVQQLVLLNQESDDYMNNLRKYKEDRLKLNIKN
jgi:hypothetical protein